MKWNRLCFGKNYNDRGGYRLFSNHNESFIRIRQDLNSYTDYIYSLYDDKYAFKLGYDNMNASDRTFIDILYPSNFFIHINYIPEYYYTNGYARFGQTFDSNWNEKYKMSICYKNKMAIYPNRTTNFKITAPKPSIGQYQCCDIFKINGVFYLFTNGEHRGSISDDSITYFSFEVSGYNDNNGAARTKIDILDIFASDTPLISGNYTPDYTTYFMEREYNLFPSYVKGNNAYGDLI